MCYALGEPSQTKTKSTHQTSATVQCAILVWARGKELLSYASFSPRRKRAQHTAI